MKAKTAPHLVPLGYSIAEGCEILRCGPTRMNDLVKIGEIASYKDGRSRRLIPQSLHDYVERRKAGVPLAPSAYKATAKAAAETSAESGPTAPQRQPVGLRRASSPVEADAT
jgi:excisionase family DNA binding protein